MAVRVATRIHCFARDNRFSTALLGDSGAREQSEPFLTSETFHVCFELIFTLQFHLRLFFQLLFNSLVLGVEIDAGLPFAFAAAFVVLAVLQWFLRQPLTAAYLHNQRMTNRMTARTYNAWDNIFSGNRYNFGLWHSASPPRSPRRFAPSRCAKAGAPSAA